MEIYIYIHLLTILNSIGIPPTIFQCYHPGLIMADTMQKYPCRLSILGYFFSYTRICGIVVNMIYEHFHSFHIHVFVIFGEYYNALLLWHFQQFVF